MITTSSLSEKRPSKPAIVDTVENFTVIEFAFTTNIDKLDFLF